jgi:hypothetical protein
MKLKDLIMARKTIFNHKDDKMPSRLAYKFMKIMKASDNEEAFYNEKLKAIIEEYSIKNDEGKTKIVDGEFRITADCISEFNSAILELENTEIDAPTIRLSLDELADVSFSITESFTLDAFIEE